MIRNKPLPLRQPETGTGSAVSSNKETEPQAISRLLSDVSARKSGDISERIATLGIPQEELTQSVKLVVSALLEKLDDTNAELVNVREHLAEMQQLVDVDCLAPIPNRRAFTRRLKWAISMRKRYNHPSSVLYFDLNNFKEINDTYGHAAGDQVIRHVSEIFTSMLRDSDFVGRIGGDEFAIIMYYADSEDAEKRSQAIADKISASPLMFNGKHIPVSTARGCYTLKEDDDAETALSNADVAMYVDKKRNRKKASSNVSA